MSHFKALHRSTGEEILFSLGDIVGMERGNHLMTAIMNDKYYAEVDGFIDWLKDYELFYLHQGEWYLYGVS